MHIYIQKGMNGLPPAGKIANDKTEATSGQIWIWASTHHDRLVTAPNTPPSIFAGSGWLWDKIWVLSWYHPSPRRTKNNLNYLLGMGWQAILWTKLRVGLIQTVISGLNAKLCSQSTAQNSISHPQEGPIWTPSMDAPKLWCYKSTGKSLGYFAANPRGTQAQDSKNNSHFPILFLCCGLYYSGIPQHNIRVKGKPNSEYWSCNYTLTVLCGQ